MKNGADEMAREGVLFPKIIEPLGAKINGKPIDFSKIEFFERIWGKNGEKVITNTYGDE